VGASAWLSADTRTTPSCWFWFEYARFDDSSGKRAQDVDITLVT